MDRTLVIQSHRTPLPFPWLERCLRSVKDWAEMSGYEYRFMGDELFATLSPHIRDKCLSQPVVASDLGRLAALEAALNEGFDAVVWFDADIFVFAPHRLNLPTGPFALGRECWVERHSERVRSFDHVHNAVLMFRPNNPFLPFYRYAAESIVTRHDGRMVLQVVGPKLLTSLHRLVDAPVFEAVNMLGPDVLRDVLAGDGPCLTRYRIMLREPVAAVNLCASLAAEGEVSESEAIAAMDRLTLDSSILQPLTDGYSSRGSVA